MLNKDLEIHILKRLEDSATLNNSFNNNTPIRHLVIDNFLPTPFAVELAENFPNMETMKTHYKGLNEKKAEHSDLHILHPSFQVLHNFLSSKIIIELIEKITKTPNISVIEDRLGYGLHQGSNGSFLDIHIDYNLHPTKKLYRKFNLILFLNEKWEKNWGGNLELWDDKVKNCVQSIQPILNRCVIFECSNISYHGYNKIVVPEGITRKSCYQYYFIPAESSIEFHDTIFKTRPEDSIVKKYRTIGKDLIKNNAKRILVKLGWKRFIE